VELHLDEARPETPSIDAAISRREGVLLSVVAHVLLFLAILFIPDIPFVRRMLEAKAAEQQRQAELLQAQQAQNQQRFVFVQPLRDIPAPKAPPRAELSDLDRVSRARERAPNPKNALPYSIGKSPERVEAQRQAEKARGEGPTPEAMTAQRGSSAAEEAAKAATTQSITPPLPQTNSGNAYTTPADRSTSNAAKTSPTTPAGGALGEALKNLQRYTEDQSLNNPDGNSGQYGPSIQFDTKGVEFGPWIRRFIAQVKRNWFIPMAAMSLKGHVVLTFNVHKTGAITDLQIVQPSPIEAFNNAAVNAIRGSNPTQPLPPEYPTDKALFTVTFFYNESPAP
jgi:TonB family protein